jgi:hypothetical protein
MDSYSKAYEIRTPFPACLQIHSADLGEGECGAGIERKIINSGTCQFCKDGEKDNKDHPVQTMSDPVC